MFMVIALVLMVVGIATFAVGVLHTSQAWVFASIGSTAAAGVVLFSVHRQGRRTPFAAGAETLVRPTSPAPMVRPPRPPPPSPAGPAAPVPSVEPTEAEADPHAEEGIDGERDEDLARVAAAPAPAPAVGGDPVPAGAGEVSAVGGEVPEVGGEVPPVGGDPAGTFADRLFVPPPPASARLGIAGYDELRVAELLPLLPTLSADRLALVRAHEGATKRRATVLARLDELLAVAGTPAEGPGDLGMPADAVEAGAARAEPAAPAEPVAPVEPAPPPASAVAVPGSPDAGGGAGTFPIAGYDALRVVDIVPLLRDLDVDELARVAQREASGARRQTVLSRIDDLLVARARGDGPPGRARGAGEPEDG